MSNMTDDAFASLEQLTADTDLDEATRAAFADVLAAIRIHGRELLGYPGVVSVRPGYRFRGTRITSQPAVRVAVLTKRDLGGLPERDLLPRRLGNVVVDVVPATLTEQLEYLGRAQSAAAVTAAGGDGGRIYTTFVGADEAPPESAFDTGLDPYEPPADTPLSPVTDTMTVICHASPDAGWKNLKKFLLGTQQRLTATMYEFNATHIRDTLLAALGSEKRMRLILDAGKPDEVPGHSDISKNEARRSLQDALDERFTSVWAAVADDHKTTKAFFKNAYHIKVTVRDGESFWLSSGNWKRSNQPTTDPFNPPPGFNKKSFLNSANREWNVIVESPSLAGLLETYIDNDIDQAIPLQVEDALAAGSAAAPAGPDLFVPQALIDSFHGSGPVQFFREQSFTKELTVQPLLTPDNYRDYMQGLIESASSRIWFQNQSLNVDTSNAGYMKLFRTLRDKSRDPNIDVRIIVRGDFNPDAILTRLSNYQFDMTRVRLQNGNHNKGIIIDDETVVIGSHNWTGAGTTFNRDASLVFRDADIAGYYGQLFSFDWDRLENTGDAMMEAMPRIAQPDEPTPPGMVRFGWSELFPE